MIAPATSNGKNGRVLCYKAFSVCKSWISPRILDYSVFFRSLAAEFSADYGKLNLLKNVGGDSKQRRLLLYTRTTYKEHNEIKYILKIIDFQIFGHFANLVNKKKGKHEILNFWHITK